MSDPSDFWNDMYADAEYRYGTAPNAWLVACSDRLPDGGRVLCVGDGEGRNGVWLAEQGFDVTTIDASSRGVEKARALAQERGVHVDAVVGLFPRDLGDVAPFDAVVLCYVHVPPAARVALHEAAAAHLAPGGAIVLEAFTPAQLPLTSGGPKDAAMLFTASMLREDFDGLHVAHLEEARVVLAEGHGHAGEAEVVRLLAVRPR